MNKNKTLGERYGLFVLNDGSQHTKLTAQHGVVLLSCVLSRRKREAGTSAEGGGEDCTVRTCIDILVCTSMPA